MRDARKVIANLSLAIIFVVACAALASARGDDERVISARAGGVNYVSGDVTFRRAKHDAWQPLATTDELKAGDAVRTGADGRAEILLNPGSYLRLDEHSEFELTDPSLDALRLKLSKGSALVEASGYSDADTSIGLDTPRTSVTLVRSGVYRVNVAASGATEVFVRKGRARVGVGRTLLKEGMSARVGAAGVAEVAKFDKKEKDALDVWGKSRAEELARAHRKLQARQVNAAFARSPWDAWNKSNGLFGLWYWSARGSCYTFMPFYFYMSPYGYTYDTWLPWLAYLCGSCDRYMRQPWQDIYVNPTPTGNIVTTPTQTMKPAKGVDFTPDNGAKMSPVKVGITVPPASGGDSPVVRGGDAPAKGTPPPR